MLTRPVPPRPSPVPAAHRGRALVVALALAAALPLAGCQDGTGYRAEATTRTAAPAPAARDACTPDMLRFHAGAAPHRARHMLLTVTNISARTCTFAAQPYPLLHFGDRHPARSPRSRAPGRPPRSRCRPTAPPTPR